MNHLKNMDTEPVVDDKYTGWDPLPPVLEVQKTSPDRPWRDNTVEETRDDELNGDIYYSGDSNDDTRNYRDEHEDHRKEPERTMVNDESPDPTEADSNDANRNYREEHEDHRKDAENTMVNDERPDPTEAEEYYEYYAESVQGDANSHVNPSPIDLPIDDY